MSLKSLILLRLMNDPQMLKKITLTHIFLIIGTLIVIIFGIFYFRNSYLLSAIATEEISFSSDTLIVLTHSGDSENVYALELKIDGSTTQGMDIDLVESGQLMQSIHFNAPIVQFEFQNDWYSDSCIVLFRPSGQGLSQLTIQHHFFSI